jgi:hypothetical protein
MMPAVDPREDARKRRARFAGIATVVTAVTTIALSESRFRGWLWALWLVSFSVIILVTSFSMRQIGPPYRRGRGSGTGAGGGPSGLVPDEAEPANPAAAYQWRTLLMVSAMMPRSAGRRWLAEAESLLSEMEVDRHGPAVRSYLLSAPRLMAMMWAHEILRRARLGPRSPG